MSHSIPESKGLPHRAIVVGSILALHVLMISLLTTGLGQRFIMAVTEPMQTRIDIQPNTPPPPPAIPNPTLMQPTQTLVAPDIKIDDPPVGDATITLPLGPATASQPPIVTSVRPETIRVVGKNQLPNSEDYYPPDLRRLGVEGSTQISVCVDGTGAPTGEPTIDKSSGNARLDEGAVRVARAGKFARALQGDMPVPFCHRFRIGFRMK